MANEAFSLTKWYFDCTTSNGRTAICYHASLAWRRLSLTWQALSLWEHGQLSLEDSAMAAAPAPLCEGDRIDWNAPQLGCKLAAQRLVQPVDVRLLERADGCVDWKCEAPAAVMTLAIAGRPPMQGTGYVERIRLTIPPWQLPIRELRWGRWIDESARHSVVWIDWRDQEPRSWVLVDGAVMPHGDVRDECVTAGSAVLTLDRSTTLLDRSLADILGRLAPLPAVVPSSLMSLREVKWQSNGTWRRNPVSSSIGTAIHERVVFHDNHHERPQR